MEWVPLRLRVGEGTLTFPNELKLPVFPAEHRVFGNQLVIRAEK